MNLYTAEILLQTSLEFLIFLVRNVFKRILYKILTQLQIIRFVNYFPGIPQNLVFNLIGWSILMILFAILRRAAGNYGRWALVRKNEDSDTKWTQLFYAPDDVSVEEDSEHAENRIGM